MRFTDFVATCGLFLDRLIECSSPTSTRIYRNYKGSPCHVSDRVLFENILI